MAEPTWYAVLVLDASGIQSSNHIVDHSKQDHNFVMIEPSTSSETGNTRGGREGSFTRISDYNASKVKLCPF